MLPQQARAIRSARRLDLTDPADALHTSPSLCSRSSLLVDAWPSSARASAACWSRSARTRNATSMLGYDTFRYKLPPSSLSGASARRAGAAYAAAVRLCRRDLRLGRNIRSCRCCGCCSAARRTTLGPIVGTLLMFYLVDIDQRLHVGLSAGRRRRADPARPVLPEGHPRHARASAGCGGCRDGLLETSGLSRHFGGLTAVDNVDFTLEPGEIRALIGPNGAGKTTFVSLICGRVAPCAGTVPFDGDDITALPPSARARAASSTPSRSPASSPISPPSTMSRWRRSARSTRQAPAAVDRAPSTRAVDGALERTGLAERAGQLAGNLSYGHQRLLEVAMGLALKPQLLILDEPTQGLSDGEIDEFHRAGARDRARRHRPADRAQHGRGDGAGPPHHRARRRRASWPKARRRRSAPTPPCSEPISGRSPMLTRSRRRPQLLLWQRAGAARLRRSSCGGARCCACSAATAPARPRCSRRSWAWCRRAPARSGWTARAHRACPPHEVPKAGIAYVPQGRRLFAE